MGKDNFAFPIPNEVLEPYIQAAVSSAIVSAVGDGKELITKAVSVALGQKVDHRGVVSTSSYDNKYNLVELVASKHIQRIAKEVIEGMAENLRPDIEREVEKWLSSQKSQIAKCLVDGFTSALMCKWDCKVQIGELRD